MTGDRSKPKMVCTMSLNHSNKRFKVLLLWMKPILCVVISIDGVKVVSDALDLTIFKDEKLR